jgi:hypothetical protein
MPLMVGIAADDVFVFSDIWLQFKKEHPKSSYQVRGYQLKRNHS